MDIILKGIMRYRCTVKETMVKQFTKVKDNPTPKAVFFSCIDSRMIPTRFTQTNVGDMFVVRNAGNIVPHSQRFPDEQSSNEPAALELGCVVNDIRHIIVCGHSDCKAINLLYKLRDPEFASQKEWLDKIDQAKKAKLSQEQQKRESSIEKPSPARSLSIDFSANNKPEEATISHPEWFLDISDELDVCIAQRQFEDAVNHLNKAEKYINKFNTQNSTPDHIVSDIQRKIEQKQNNLVEMLMRELEVNPEKSLQGGLRATRTAVRLLNQLGRSTQSCDLFLKLCSNMLKTQGKRVKREGSTTTYVRHLSSVVFTNMCHMSEEFLRAFPDSSDCASAYVVWASGELSLFTTHFAKQVFMPQTSLSTITECVVLVRSQCERLCTYGVDFRYQLDGALRSPLSKALNDARDKFIDSIKLRAIDDKWIPMNLTTRSGLAKCLQEHANMGLKLDSYVTGDVWLQLTSSNIAFTKAFLTLLDDCLKLKTTELLHPIDETLYRVFEAQIRYNEQALRNELQPEQKQFILKNAEFLLLILMGLVQKKYKDEIGYECELLNKLVNEYTVLFKSSSNRNTKTKYSSDFL